MKVQSLLTFTLLIILGASCDYGKKKIALEEISLEGCPELKSLKLPIGNFKKSEHSYEEGHITTFIYPDSSYIMVLCGGNADLGGAYFDGKDNYSKEEYIKSAHLKYGNVPKDRIDEFEYAFEAMKE